MTTTISTEQIADVVALAYGRCTPGTGSTFVHMVFILDSLLGRMPNDGALEICAKCFPQEHEAWQRGFDDDAPYAGRMGLRFPELN